MRSCRLLIALLAALLLSVPRAFAQAPEHDLKAAFIYNFVQYTQWPESVMKGAMINICASPGSLLHMALQAIAGKSAHGRVITVVPLQNAGIGDCHVVVATSEDRGRLPQIRKLLANNPVLGVTDDPEILREGMIIGMAVEGGRITFIADNSRASASGLTLSSRLLRLARSVQ